MTETAQDKAIGIIRVSSAGQANKDKYGKAAQKSDIRDKADALDNELLDIWEYVESATDSANRPRFNEYLHRLMDMGKQGELQTLIFGAPDRLGRDGAMAFMGYMHDLEGVAGLSVRFQHKDVDPADPNRELLLCISAVGAKSEAVDLKRRAGDGLHERAKSGYLPNGNNIWPHNYQSKARYGAMADQRVSLNPERTEWVRKWARWIIDDGLGLQQICNRMNGYGVITPGVQKDLDRGTTLENALARRKTPPKWRKTSISDILKHPAMLGVVVSYKNEDEPIVIETDSVS